MAINREKFLEVFDETTGNREQDKELLESYEDDAKVFLLKLQNNNFPLYGLIGEYGTGKSTFLNAVKHYDEQDENTNNIRITFEARKYPNRKELWDAFIIEVLAQVISQVIDEGEESNVFNEMEKIKNKMLGGQYTKDDSKKSRGDKLKKSAGNILQSGGDAIISAGSIQNEGSLEKIGYTGVGIFAKFLGNSLSRDVTQLKEGVSRIFDYEYFFAQYRIEIINKYYDRFNKVYIIIEDIDRCGKDGLVFLETLSYFMNNISKLEHNMDKMTCIVSIGQGFLNDNWHLINKAITSYEIFNMKNESIQKYFYDLFQKEELGFSNAQQTNLTNFLKFYLNTHDSFTRTIREIKYLFKKILPEIIDKNNTLITKGIIVDDNIILGMILYNFSLFVRSNRKPNTNGSFSNEIFNSMSPLYYCRIFGTGSSYFYLPYLDIQHNRSLGWFHKDIFKVLFSLETGYLAQTYDFRVSDDEGIDKGLFFTFEEPYSQDPHSRNYYLNISSYWLLDS